MNGIMLKLLFLSALYISCRSDIALSTTTAEKWLCERGNLKRTARLVAESLGSAPCQVFYAKRTEEDPDDLIIEQKQDSGEVKPIYWAKFQGDFCVKKIGLFIRERQTKGWLCTRLFPT